MNSEISLPEKAFDELDFFRSACCGWWCGEVFHGSHISGVRAAIWQTYHFTFSEEETERGRFARDLVGIENLRGEERSEYLGSLSSEGGSGPSESSEDSPVETSSDEEESSSEALKLHTEALELAIRPNWAISVLGAAKGGTTHKKKAKDKLRELVLESKAEIAELKRASKSSASSVKREGVRSPQNSNSFESRTSEGKPIFHSNLPGDEHPSRDRHRSRGVSGVAEVLAENTGEPIGVERAVCSDGSLAGDADEEVGDSSLPKVVTKKGRMLPPRAIVAG
ncbi:hypothetical protein OUZ56_010427 [Daphnia magna]|uniref:Uncharacterized protein n=1 Tax=Daphnia magna TaxID=35525 RepID=A0ABR0AIJ5_9CRUS|nr:hypothetical protein OUZ56_010427 [Daphnia magna]